MTEVESTCRRCNKRWPNPCRCEDGGFPIPDGYEEKRAEAQRQMAALNESLVADGMTPEVREAFTLLFGLAEQHSGRGRDAARALLGAWFNVRLCGAISPRDLWHLDAQHRAAAAVVMGWYLGRNALEGTTFDRRIRALVGAIAKERGVHTGGGG